MDPILVLEGSGAQRAEFAAVLPAPSPADSTVSLQGGLLFAAKAKARR